MLQNRVEIAYRTPFRFRELLDFFRARALQGVEFVDDTSYSRAVRVEQPDGEVLEGWIHIEDDARENRLVLSLSESLIPRKEHLAARVKNMFDLDCNPATVAEGLASFSVDVPGVLHEGTRLPGCFDSFETACRAVLGQQVSVAAANKLAARIVERYGHVIDDAPEGVPPYQDARDTYLLELVRANLSRTWPTPKEVLALDSAEDAFGELGIIKTRSRVIVEIARLIEDGLLDFGPDANAKEQIKTLLSIKGVGPWTANYIAMRTLGHPDAFLESDAGVKHALPDLTPKQRLALAERWRPWRSYAVINLWNSLCE